MTRPGNRSRVRAALFALTFLAYALVHNGRENPNALGRIGLTLALIERGSPFIGEIARTTPDHVKVGARFASDKAPAVSVMAVPAVAVARALLSHRAGGPVRWVTERGRPTAELRTIVAVATVTTASLLGAVGVVALFDTALALGAEIVASLFAALLLAFATPYWGWSTALFGHVPSAAFLVLSLRSAAMATATPSSISRRRRLLHALTVGLFAGLAVASEYPTAIAAAVVVAFAGWRARGWSGRDRLLGGAAVFAGLAIAVAPLLAYHAWTFGSPVAIGYARPSRFTGMQRGLFGVGLPSAETLFELVLGRKRGLVWLAPCAVLFPLALREGVRTSRTDAALACALSVASFLGINAGYVYWDGGWSTGPRHLTAALPFLALPFAWIRFPAGSVASAAIVMAIPGLAVNLVAATCGMEAPDRIDDVVQGYLVPTLLHDGPTTLALVRLGVRPWTALVSYLAVLAVPAVLLRRWSHGAGSDTPARTETTP